ncbi:hypothetical protein TNCV_1782111 [Trichonephila clavipes]|nr:hypothetical protein TNCV_1782111 [Trichonephila clavipes]
MILIRLSRERDKAPLVTGAQGALALRRLSEEGWMYVKSVEAQSPLPFVGRVWIELSLSPHLLLRRNFFVLQSFPELSRSGAEGRFLPPLCLIQCDDRGCPGPVMGRRFG